MIKVKLLGPPRVEVHGVVAGFDTRKATALLAYLAVTGQPRSRDALAELLWPDRDVEHARGALRRTLSTLRAALGPDAVEATRDRVGLSGPPTLIVDVERFRALRAAGDHAGAIELCRGDFLEGFGIRGAPAFDDWQMREGDALRRELAAALAFAVAARMAVGDYASALAYGRRWLALDPLHEPAHRELIRLYATIGDRAAAMEQYRACGRTLARELGVTPLPETTALYEAIGAGTFEPPPAPAPATGPPTVSSTGSPPGPPGTVPFVGRRDELRSIGAVHADITVDGRVVLVEGEAGIGKTRLADQVVAQLRERGAVVLTARGYEDEAALAYLPVADALRTRLRSGTEWLAAVPPGVRAEVGRLLPELTDAGTPPAADGPGAETRFLAGLWNTLVAALNGPVPGVLYIDDAHWLDEASLRLLGYGLRRLSGCPVLVLLTWRPPRDHAVRRTVATLDRGATGLVRRLRPLDADAVRVLAEAAGVPASGARLHTETAGVPLMVVEYLGALDQAGGESWPVPTGVRDLLRARVDRLSDTARQVLAAGATVGRSFDVETVRRVSGRGDEETVTALEELVAHGLVREGSVAYDFSHDQLRVLIYEELSLARRRLLHSRAAAVPGLPAGAVARHLHVAGRDAEAAPAYVAAAERAAELYANSEAIDHLRAALAVGYPDRRHASIRLGDLLARVGEYDESLRAYEAAAVEAGGADIQHRLGRVRHRRGEWALAAAHFRAALESEPAPERKARILVDLGLTRFELGDAPSAEALARRAFDLARAAAEEQALGRAYNLLGMVAAGAGESDRALRYLESGHEIAQRIGDVAGQIAVLNNLALTRRQRAELDDARRLTHEALVLCTTVGDRHREAALHNNLADIHHDLGDTESAMEHLKRAVAIFGGIGEDAIARPEVWKLVRW